MTTTLYPIGTVVYCELGIGIVTDHKVWDAGTDAEMTTHLVKTDRHPGPVSFTFDQLTTTCIPPRAEPTHAKIYWPRMTDDPNTWMVGYFTDDGGHGNRLVNAPSAPDAITAFWEVTGYKPMPLGKRYRQRKAGR